MYLSYYTCFVYMVLKKPSSKWAVKKNKTVAPKKKPIDNKKVYKEQKINKELGKTIEELENEEIDSNSDKEQQTLKNGKREEAKIETDPQMLLEDVLDSDDEVELDIGVKRIMVKDEGDEEGGKIGKIIVNRVGAEESNMHSDDNKEESSSPPIVKKKGPKVSKECMQLSIKILNKIDPKKTKNKNEVIEILKEYKNHVNDLSVIQAIEYLLDMFDNLEETFHEFTDYRVKQEGGIRNWKRMEDDVFKGRINLDLEKSEREPDENDRIFMTGKKVFSGSNQVYKKPGSSEIGKFKKMIMPKKDPMKLKKFGI